MKATIEQFQEFVRDKTVVVVGNSESLFTRRLGAFVDEHEVVVRLNLGKIRKPLHQGTRTDVVFTSAEKLTTENVVEWFAPKWLVWATNKRHLMPDYSDFDGHVTMHPLEVWSALYEKVAPGRPSTGLITANFLACYCDCARVSLVGFDFFASGTFYHRNRFGMKRKRKGALPHDPDKEKALIEGLIQDGCLFSPVEQGKG